LIGQLVEPDNYRLSRAIHRILMVRVMITKQDWERRQSQWAAFHNWEASQDADPCPAAAAIGDLGAILEWLPEDVQRKDPDPAKTGIRRMHAIVGLLAQPR
jgi:hypothetical protein